MRTSTDGSRESFTLASLTIAAIALLTAVGCASDPQTSGGLLVAVAPEAEANVLKIARDRGLTFANIGALTEWNSEELVEVVSAAPA